MTGQVGNLSYGRAAFTLIELIVVVVIIVMVMAVTLPAVKYSIEEGKLREGARQFNAYFALAKARATSTGRPAGVWLELTQIGDPNAAAGSQLFQCSQLYLAEVPPPYSGDVLNARAVVRNGQGNNNALDPSQQYWFLDFADSPGSPPDPLQAPSVASLLTTPGGLLRRPASGEPPEPFYIRFDGKAHLYLAERRSDGYCYIRNQGVIPPRANGISSGANPTNGGYSFQILRSPQRTGQPLELPQGIVIDPNYSGAGPGGQNGAQLTGLEFSAARGRILVLFSPVGGVASVSFVHQNVNLPLQVDMGTSKIHFLVGRTDKMERPFNQTIRQLKEHNIADGSNLWVTVNRRTGSVATVANAPNPNLPYSTVAERGAFIASAREFATGGEVKGGQ